MPDMPTPWPHSDAGAVPPRSDSPPLARLLHRYPFCAPIEVLEEVQELHDRAVGAVGVARGDAGATALEAALAVGLLARTCLDRGDMRAAIAQADAALHLAARANSDAARPRLRALQSEAAHWAGWPHEAQRYSRLGADIAELRGTGFAMVKAVEARSHAVLGDSAGMWDALRAADKALAAAAPDALDTLGGNLRLDQARRRYFEAEARVHIRDGAQGAGECAVEAVGLFAEAAADPSIGETRTAPEAAAALAVLALAQVRRHRLDDVRATLDGLLSLEPARRTAPVTLSAARVHAALLRPEWVRSREVRDMQEQLEAFCQVSPGSVPNG